MATIAIERERIKAILDTYNPAWKTHRYLPRQLNSGELPAFIILPTTGLRERVDTYKRKVTRIYRIQLYIAPLTDGVSNQTEKAAETYPDAIADFLDAHLRLGLPGTDQGLNGVQDSVITSDGGLTAAPFPQGDNNPTYYLMIEWQCRITSMHRLSNPI